MNIRNSSNRDNVAITNSQPAQISTELRQRLTSLGASNSDLVSLSKFSAALGAGDSNSPQQVERLAALGAAAASGLYQIDAPSVSESIVNGHFRG
jgi:hypothetical protein